MTGRPNPWRFDSYIAASARATNASAVIGRWPEFATPRLACGSSLVPARWTGRHRARLIRSATHRAGANAADPRTDDEELVSADPSQRVIPADGDGQAVCDDPQQLVPGGVAERIVHRLEAVEVDEDRRGPIGPRPGESILDDRDHGGTVHDPSEHVMGRAPLELGTESGTLRDVLEGQDRAGGPPQLIGECSQANHATPRAIVGRRPDLDLQIGIDARPTARTQGHRT